MKNTLVIDINGLNEPLRIIGIYWPDSQKREIEEITQFITKNTIITGDFNASVEEWNSPNTDKRGVTVKNWCDSNNLQYISCTKNSSKRSARNIDLTFTNKIGITGTTLDYGTSDHWPLLYQSDFIFFQTITKFPIIHWKLYEITLCLLQDYWSKQIEYATQLEWYKQYVRFLAALKNRLTAWKEKEKWKPSLPHDILKKLKEIKLVKTFYYQHRYEETRIILRVKTREIKKEISEHRSARWSDFLSSVQNYYDKSSNLFWKHMSRIYRPSTVPFNKLRTQNN